MSEERNDQGWEGQDESGLDSSGSKTEQIRGLVDSLAENYQQVRREKPGGVSRLFAPGRDLTGKNLAQYETWLTEAHRYFQEASQQNAPLTYASEWVLDNYYIIRQALQQIKEDLPASYYNELPGLTEGPMHDFPRIYAIARTILFYQHLLLEPVDLQTILIQLQEQVLLTMGELWALPIFLRYGLIEFLAQELVSTIHPASPPDLPAIAQQLAGVDGLTAPGEAAAGGIANIILSLRSISEQDWSDFFESVSRQERTLRSDPAAIYAQMDFKTRDLYRKEVEKLSVATGREENELAETIVSLARAGVVNDPAILP
ncbi:hypothetical protein EG834_22330, partial [bacterium]|nr:hypothetical protein [bacterium]